MGKPTLILLLLALSTIAYAQPELPGNDNRVYDADIRSVRFTPGGRALGMPIINFNSNTQLHLRFDDITGDTRNLYYSVIHCDADWTPSRLRLQEYLDGFDREELWTYQYSSMTYHPYTYYDLSIPNERTNLLVPGNYILYVYEDDVDQPILTQRFILVDTQVKIEARTRKAVLSGQIQTHQAIEFWINHEKFKISDPADEIKAYVMQNADWNTMIEAPMRSFRGKVINFDFPGKIVFPGKKEFRVMDLRSVDLTLPGIRVIEKDDLGYRLFLEPVTDRRGEFYSNRIDLNGGYVISNYDNQGGFRPNFSVSTIDELQELRSEYVRAVVTLTGQPPGGDFYVTGMFSLWNLDEEYRMQYVEEYDAYMAEIWLKQGYYDYEIVSVDYSKVPPSRESLSGNWYETENDYQIIIYHRGFTDRYDRPVGVLSID